MIEYADELIEEIKANKPNGATTITVSGVPINSVRYTGVGLEIFIDSEGFVEKERFYELEQEYDWLKDEKEGLEDDISTLESNISDYEEALEKIRDIVFFDADKSETFDKILGIINEVTK